MNYDPIAALYQLQYAQYHDDVHFYSQLANRIGGDVLELGAGSGRVSIPIARRGLQVTGLEYSAQMLAYAQHNAQEAGVLVDWLLGDMRNFALNRHFPLIIAPFNALMHLYTPQDQLQALRCVAAHMDANSIFVCDLYQPNFGPEGVLRHEGDTFEHPDGRRTDVWLLQRVDRSQQLVHTQYYVDTSDAQGQLSRQYHTLKQRYYHRWEVEWLWRCAGLEVYQVQGNFEGEYLHDKSSHLVVHARKLSDL